MTKFTKLLSNLSPDDLPSVGATNIAKSQTIQLLSKLHIPMPGGWIVTTDSFRHFIASTDLHEIISHNLAGLKVKNRTDLMDRSTIIRRAIESTPFPKDFDEALTKAFLDVKIRFGKDCSFHASLSIINSKNSTEQILPLKLNISDIDQIKTLIHEAYSFQFSEQSIFSRAKQKIDLSSVAIAINFYQSVRSDESISGLIFTLDRESNHPDFVTISSTFGLPEHITTDTDIDQYLVFKPKLDKFHPLISSHIAHKTHKIIFDSSNSELIQTIEIDQTKQDQSSLSNPEIFQLAKWAVQIEKSYIESNILSPLQITWAKDTPTDKFYILDIQTEIPLPLSSPSTPVLKKTHIIQNITDPNTALHDSFLTQNGSIYQPNHLISHNIGIHPLALINYSKQPDLVKNEIDQKVTTSSKTNYYVDQLKIHIAKVSSAFYPHPVIISLSDLTSNEYHHLIGGELYDDLEINPLLGLHGTPRYLDRKFQPILELEIQAIKQVYEELGLDNLRLAIPFCLTPEQGKEVCELINKFGLSRRHHKNIQFYLLAQTPANFILAEDFLKVFDGLIIDTDTLHRLTTGTSPFTNQLNLAEQALIAQVTKITRKTHKFLSALQSTPSPSLTTFLYHQDISTLGINSSDLSSTIKLLHELEADSE